MAKSSERLIVCRCLQAGAVASCYDFITPRVTAQAARAVKGSRVSSHEPSVYKVISTLTGIKDSVDMVVLRKNMAWRARSTCSWSTGKGNPWKPLDLDCNTSSCGGIKHINSLLKHSQVSKSSIRALPAPRARPAPAPEAVACVEVEPISSRSLQGVRRGSSWRARSGRGAGGV